MIKRFAFTLFGSLISTGLLLAQAVSIKSPDDFLPYKLGSRVTPHHLLVDYFKYVDGVSDKVQIVNYGMTNELRPLFAAIISTPENLRRIEDIRLNNLRRTGMISGNAVAENIAIVYLSYSVHGNEVAGSESAMAVLFDLVKGNEEYNAWLKNTIVIIDPALNPDGYSRYSQWSNSISNQPFNASLATREHKEPWPGGRFNHYYFDLNRDWVWQMQKESRERLDFYHRWMPHVHADIHEMSHESPYYFAPAAQPYHPNITKWQVDFQGTIGKNHARHFDKEGWRYFTRERYDLFYPSYGDTYPTFAGAIGMTYEQGGSGRANRAVALENGDTLTLADRIAHHRTSSLSTIEISAKHASQLVTEFANYFKQSIDAPHGIVRNYVINKKYYPGRVSELLSLLDRNHITYAQMSGSKSDITGYNYMTGKEESFTANDGDIVIRADQPKGVLLHVLFEPNVQIPDSLTYDITAWCVPVLYGLQAYATATELSQVPFKPTVRQSIPADAKPFAYALSWGSVDASEALATFLEKGIIARYASTSFTIDDVKYPEGTVLLMRGDNRKNKQFDAIVKSVADSASFKISLVPSGFVDNGQDLGSDNYLLVRQPKVLAFAGDGILPMGIGEVWHFFEEGLHYPIHLTHMQDIREIVFDDYNVVLLTDGFYTLDEDVIQKLNKWVSAGGRLVLIGSAINKFEGKASFAIKSISKNGHVPDTIADHVHVPEAYADRERSSLSESMPGAIFQTTLDHSHPLTFGLGDSYWTLKGSTSNFAWLEDSGNAIYLDDTPDYLGFAGYKAKEKTRKTMIAGQQDLGAGSVVYFVDNPLFRSMWPCGKVLFSNALFF